MRLYCTAPGPRAGALTAPYPIDPNGNRFPVSRVIAHEPRRAADEKFREHMSPRGICGEGCTDPSMSLVATLAEALDARDPYTAGHSVRVAEYAWAIACALNLSDPQRHMIRVAAQLHDVGKIGIPDAILLKVEPLTPQEWGLIKLHPQIGRRILERGQLCETLLDIVEQHHENFDGSGYPFGTSGDRIPLGARIIRVADSFDAMTTARAYRTALPVQAALAEIRAGIGQEFDPRCASAFVTVIETSENWPWTLPDGLNPLAHPAPYAPKLLT